MPNRHPPVTILLAGHVDHGKSTLIGRLLHETGTLQEGKREAIEGRCKQRGEPFEWAYVTDALQAERAQNVTIDIAPVWLKLGEKRIMLMDAPGHAEFLQNMLTGAQSAEGALLLVDAEEGLKEQTRLHAYLLALMGIRQMAVVINKMDRVAYDREVFARLMREITAYLAPLQITPLSVLPLSAREGENMAAAPTSMPWYRGPTLLAALDAFTPAAPDTGAPLRLPIQDVYRWGDRRILVGRMESGRLKAGDTLLFSPLNATARVASIEAWNASSKQEAWAGEAVGITLDTPLFIERGAMASHVDHPPCYLSQFRARLFWLCTVPLTAGVRMELRVGTARYQAEVRVVERVVDVETFSSAPQSYVARGQVAEVLLRIRGLAAVDNGAALPRTGRFVLVQEGQICGAGVVDTHGFPDQRIPLHAPSENLTPVLLPVTPEERKRANGHGGGILWFTGLSGSGKSTLAQELEKRLFAAGFQVYVLDGDNIRRGLCRDLGFSPEERHENIRRASEVAALFADAGFIVITSFITPTEADRNIARAAAAHYFHEVYIKADLATCEKRDVKGLYSRARQGEIKNFTGISAPYEEPKDADLVIDTMTNDIGACVEQLIRYTEKQFKDK